MEIKKLTFIAVCVAIFSVSIIFVSIITSYTGIADTLQKRSYIRVSKIFEENILVESIARACSLYEEDYDKVYCVKTIVSDNYKFVDHHNNSMFVNLLRKSPEEFFEDGGKCRDVTIIYKSIFDEMGIKSEFVLIPHHVYNRVFIDREAWIIDGWKFVREDLSL